MYLVGIKRGNRLQESTVLKSSKQSFHLRLQALCDLVSSVLKKALASLVGLSSFVTYTNECNDCPTGNYICVCFG